MSYENSLISQLWGLYLSADPSSLEDNYPEMEKDETEISVLSDELKKYLVVIRQLALEADAVFRTKKRRLTNMMSLDDRDLEKEERLEHILDQLKCKYETELGVLNALFWQSVVSKHKIPFGSEVAIRSEYRLVYKPNDESGQKKREVRVIVIGEDEEDTTPDGTITH